MSPSLPRTSSLLDQGLATGLHIGAQLAVSLDGERVGDLAIGESRPGAPMRADTLMPWLSCTKPLGAIVVGRLLESGVLELDDPVASHIPEFGVHGKDAITLRHLLTHTGGFRLVEVDWARQSWEEILRDICEAHLEPEWVPGRKAGYHRENSWYILAEVLQRRTGRLFPDIVREDLFDPLEMFDSWVVLPPDRYRRYGDRIGILQDTRNRKGPPRPHDGWDTEEGAAACRPGGGARGPASDLVRIYEMLLDGGTWEHAHILKPGTVDLLTRRHRRRLFDDTFRHTVDWGLGFIVNSNRYGARTVPYGFGLHASERTFGHGGQQSSASFADPEHRLAAAVILNGTPGEPRHTIRIRDLLTALYEDLGLA